MASRLKIRIKYLRRYVLSIFSSQDTVQVSSRLEYLFISRYLSTIFSSQDTCSHCRSRTLYDVERIRCRIEHGSPILEADCCRDCLYWLDRFRLFQKTINSSQYFPAHLKTCVVTVDLESNRRSSGTFWLFPFPNVLRFAYIYSGYASLFVFIGMENSVLFVGLQYISFIVDCE